MKVFENLIQLMNRGSIQTNRTCVEEEEAVARYRINVNFDPWNAVIFPVRAKKVMLFVICISTISVLKRRLKGASMNQG